MEDVNFSCRNLFHWWLLGGLSSLSGWTGHDVRPVQCPFFPLVSFCPLLLDWKHVQLSHHSVSATISLSPRLKKKKPKGPPGKVACPRLSGLMSKMFQSSGNLLQSGILSLFTSKSLNDRVRKREREKWEGEKWYWVVGSDRSTFFGRDMPCEWGVLVRWCWLSAVCSGL